MYAYLLLFQHVLYTEYINTWDQIRIFPPQHKNIPEKYSRVKNNIWKLIFVLPGEVKKYPFFSGDILKPLWRGFSESTSQNIKILMLYGYGFKSRARGGGESIGRNRSKYTLPKKL